MKSSVWFAIVMLLLFNGLVAQDELTCESTHIYVKTIKMSISYANEESFVIKSDNETVATSPLLVDNQLRESEFCLPVNDDGQYLLEMRDSYGDGWTSGSWLAIEGPYGNIIFKNFMVEKVVETFMISLYMPILKYSSWKMTLISPESSWTSVSFSDSTWTDVTLGSIAEVTNGTQYYRKAFSGITGLSAYELRFNYQYGIIAYINGNEVYRDNMPSGAITSTTPASGSYQINEYRGVLRSASEVTVSESILAVEIHFTQSTQSTTDFDAWLAVYASSDQNTDCMVVTSEITINPTSFQESLDWNAVTSSSFVAMESVTYSFDPTLTPFINGYRIFPQNVLYSPTAFSLEGSTSADSSSPYQTILNLSEAEYTEKVYSTFQTMFNGGLYKSIRFTPSSTQYTLSLYEAVPLVCNVPLPTTIEFDQSEYEYYVIYSQVHIAPIIQEYKNCSISPSLPQGLVFDAANCAVTGVATQVLNKQEFTITSTQFGLSGSFYLTITSCSGTMVEIVRSYKSDAAVESFSIVDADTNDVIYSVAPYTSQQNYMDWNTVLCITNTRISVDMDSTTSMWYSDSYIYLNAYLSPTEKEPLIRSRYDSQLSNPTSVLLSTLYTIPVGQSWFYKMGDIPSNWYDSSTAGWTEGSFNAYPSSSNQIQLYKKSFTVQATQNLGAISISLRYLHGCIIYLNNHEVFRNGVEGSLSNESLATQSYTTLSYHTITLPLKTIAVNNTESVNYIQQGANQIAIALVAINPTQLNSTFDCALRFLGDTKVSRVLDYSTSSSITSLNADYAFDYISTHFISSTTCDSNTIDIVFENDRREWISSVTIQGDYNGNFAPPKQFSLQARNTNSEEWVTLSTVTQLVWSLVGQRNRVWILNNKAYNQYRFKDFGSGDSTACYWGINQIDLLADDMLQTIPDLTYPETSVIYSGIEMAEVYPSSDYYYDFSIQPALPSGVSMNSNTGVISGTASEIAPSVTYTITAKRCTGGTVTVSFPLSVEYCTNGKALMTVVIRADSFQDENGYKLYEGRGTSGRVIRSVTSFPVISTLFYMDHCLPDGIYTFEAIDTYGDGWAIPAGYYLTVDVGELRYDMNMVPNGEAPVKVTTTFSSLIPFQCSYTEWKVYKNTEAIADNWFSSNYDDSTWTSMKAADIGTTEAVTVYLRKSFTIPNLDDYSVLNVRVVYAGGVVAYLNGNKVARFNLAESFTSSTESISIHDSTNNSYFHILLAPSGAVEGVNVIAFEVHRPLDQSSANAVVFDATGVFGVEECSTLIDSYTNVNGTFATEETLLNLLDLSPVSFVTLPTVENSYFQWSVENLEGTKFNHYGFFLTPHAMNWGYTLYGRQTSSDNWIPMSEVIGVNSTSRKLTTYDSPLGFASFKQFKWNVDSTASSTISIFDTVFKYCKPAGAGICQGDTEYPSVAEGSISPGPCPAGYSGYSYKQCTNGQLGEVVTEHCQHLLPHNIIYENSYLTLVLDTNVAITPPTYDNIIHQFYLDETTSLPKGLVLDETTGAITGIPQEELPRKAFTIYGSNPTGASSTVITILVRKGECKGDGVFTTTKVGETAIYECSAYGSYIGTQKRACVLGAKDGEWQSIKGSCFSVTTIVIIVIVIVIIIAIVLFFIIRARSKKSVGGMKGKKTSGKALKKVSAAPKKSTNSTQKKNLQKTVKVY